jgi:RHS repeat-associated protein
MKLLQKKYDPRRIGKNILAWILLACLALPAFATEEPYINELKGPQVVAGSFLTVSDEKFDNNTSWGLIDQHINVDNIVSFEINFDTSIYFYNQPFACTVNFKIYIYGNQSDTSQVTDSTTHSNISLQVRYDTVTGKPYKGIALYKFKGVHKFKIKILNVTSAELSPIPAIFRLKSEIIINRKYTFSDASTDVTRFSIVNGNQLKLEWTPSLYLGAEMFDLEYTFIDRNTQIAGSLAGFATGNNYTVPADTLAKWFRNNNTRITTAAPSHIINATYDSGFILFRIRGVQIHYPDNIRWEGNWNYTAKESGDACTGDCPSGVVAIDGHEQNLNWQFSISFAEEGKNKEVISYFDGSLRNRQSVTIINTDNKSVIQETIYDALGRPAASILPVPTNDSTIHYFRGFNRNSAGDDPYSFADLSYGDCSTTADSISYLYGAGRYYSPANPFMHDRPYTKYIPNAGGYPLTVTEYMADNTGRIKAQGGVGPSFQLGSGHETSYFYGKPTQIELDRLFGSEAGIASHYLKNMVVDPNGQISVSYMDASGKTIATALAGITPPHLHSLPSNKEGTSVRVSNDLITPSDFSINTADYSLTASATFLAPVTGEYLFKYRIDPLQYSKMYGPGKDTAICSNCYYDLIVLFKDDCNNLLASDTVVAGNIFDTACNPLPQPIIDSVPVEIHKIGEYYVTYNLQVSKDALNYYDSVHFSKNSDIRKLNFFLLEELKNTDFTGCYNNCENCRVELGEKEDFITMFKNLYGADSVYFDGEDSVWASLLYDSLLTHCASIEATCGKTNVCDEKLALLKLDVSPGGQYALYDNSYNLIEPLINMIRRRNELSFFKDENGNRDSVVLYNAAGEDSIKQDVMALDDSTFIKYWKDVWADELVKLHPEYCNYLWCLANSNSKQFDMNLQNMEDADSAIALNWFKPNDYKALLDSDPFFANGGGGAAIYNYMRDSLQYFSRTYAGFSQSDKNILQFIDIILYCNKQYNGWDACNPDSACRSRNKEWFLYKNLYLNLKERFYEAARRASPNPVFANCANCFIGGDLGAQCYPASDFTTFVVNGPPAEAGSCLGNSPRVHYNGTAPITNDIFLNITLHTDQNTDTTFNIIFPANATDLRIDCLPELYNWFLDNQYMVPSVHVDSVTINSVICSPIFVDVPPSNFVDSTCNYSCPDGIYPDIERVHVSYYIEHGVSSSSPTGTPEGYENCRFYPAFKLNTGASSSCMFNNVWVCVRDSTPPSCPICTDIPVDTLTVQNGGSYGCGCDINTRYNISTVTGLPFGQSYNLYIKVYLYGTDTVIIRPFSAGASYYVLDEIGRGSGIVVDSISIIQIQCDSSALVCAPFVNPQSSCPDNENAQYYRNKIRRYPEYVNPDQYLSSLSSINPQASSEQSAQSIITECHSNCEAQADIWVNSLKRCNVDISLLEYLKYYFIDICSKACSIDRPFGASSIPLDITADYHSFEEAMVDILGPTTLNDSCTAELLASPYPYDKQPVLVDRMVTETDYATCQKIGQQKQAWTSSGFTGSFHAWLQKTYSNAYRLDSLELNDLLNSCTNCNGMLKENIILPVIFDPGSGPCLSCDSANAALDAFNAKYPTIDSTTQDYEVLFANFFNHRFGFGLNYDQYRTFLDSCANPGYAYTLCNQPITQDDTTTNEINSCTAELFATALTNATSTYIVYVDSVHRDFRDAWMTKCLNVQAKLNMTADLYEYHYTLYYYDQSGNLVKTVPPEGVDLLDDNEIADVQKFRLLQSEGCYQYSDSIKFNNNGQITWPVTASQFGQQPFSLESNINLSSHANQVIVSKLQEITLIDSVDVPYYVQLGYTVNVVNNKLEVDLYGLGLNAEWLNDSVQRQVKAISTAAIANLLPVDQWRHIAVEYTADLTDPVRVYINGDEIAMGYNTNELSGFTIVNTSSSFIAGAHNSPNLTLPGKLRGMLKNLRVYDRLLSANELRQNAFNVCQLPSNQSALSFWSVMNSAAGSLVPEAINRQAGTLSGFTWTAANGTFPGHRLPTVYQYNSLNQVLQQYSPDGDTSQFFYDRLGRLAVSQNKEQKENASYSGTANRFSYTKYDALGRIIEVGEKSGPADDVHNIDMLDTTAVKNWLASGTDRQLTRTIYDEPVNITLQTLTTSRKRVTASIYLENSGDSEGDSSIYVYDINGNVKTLVQHVKALVAVDATNGRKRIDYDYDLVSGKVNQVDYQHGKGDQFYYRYDYDADNRVTRSLSSRDKLIWTEDASYSYYLHGPLARTELGQYKVQGIDYTYTLQGWLKGMNSDSLSPAYDMAGDGKSGTLYGRVSRDVYGFKLGYYNGDYVPIGGAGATAFGVKTYTAPSSLANTGDSLFDGNISFSTLALSKINGGATTGYTYGYDQLNRLTAMRQHITNAGGGWSNSNILTAYGETIAYDANGNILKYLRKGTAGTPDMDSLNYNYNRDVDGHLVNNRLNHVRDQVNAANYAEDIDNQSANNYNYDKIGNLIKDAAEHLDTVRWTMYGKINRIVKSASGTTVIDYGYDPAGNRTSKKVNINDTITTTFYVRDAQGNVLGIYSVKDEDALKWNEQHLYGSNRLGMWNWDTLVPASAPVVGGGTSLYDSLLLGSRTYELSNHLGNVLVTISDKKIGNDSSGLVNYYISEVLSQNDYYPFGMKMLGRTYSDGIDYRYGFNGKENDNDVKGEGNQQDYGMRIYDPRLGRFLSVDPLSRNYSYYTPYSYAGNKPIRFIDLDGAEEGKHWYEYNFNDFMSWLGDPDNPFEDNGFVHKATTSLNRTANPLYNASAVIFGEENLGPSSDNVPMTRSEAGFNLLTQGMLWKYARLANAASGPAQMERELAKNSISVGVKPTMQRTAVELSNEEKQKLIAWIKQNTSTGYTSIAQKATKVEVTTAKNFFGGNNIKLVENKTTTIIGRFTGGVEHVIATGEFRTGINNGGLNVLNLKNWAWYKNQQWLQAAIKRGDVIRAVSDPRKAGNIWKNGIIGGERTTFGKEVEMLEKAGYKFNSKTSEFVKG